MPVTIRDLKTESLSVGGQTVAYSDIKPEERASIVSRVLNAIKDRLVIHDYTGARNACRKVYGWMHGLPSYLLDVDECGAAVAEAFGYEVPAEGDEDDDEDSKNESANEGARTTTPKDDGFELPVMDVDSLDGDDEDETSNASDRDDILSLLESDPINVLDDDTLDLSIPDNVDNFFDWSDPLFFRALGLDSMPSYERYALAYDSTNVQIA